MPEKTLLKFAFRTAGAVPIESGFSSRLSELAFKFGSRPAPIQTFSYADALAIYEKALR